MTGCDARIAVVHAVHEGGTSWPTEASPYGRDVVGCGDRELSIIIYDASTRFHNKKEVNLLQSVGLFKSRRSSCATWHFCRYTNSYENFNVSIYMSSAKGT